MKKKNTFPEDGGFKVVLVEDSKEVQEMLADSDASILFMNRDALNHLEKIHKAQTGKEMFIDRPEWTGLQEDGEPEEAITCSQCRWFQYASPESEERNKVVGRCQNKGVMGDKLSKLIMIYCDDVLVSWDFGCIFAQK